MTLAYIGLGSNLGDLERNLASAVGLLEQTGRVRSRSTFRLTAPVGFADQDDFLNGVVEIDTELEPDELLRRLREIERALGRRPTFRYGPRVIDLDLLLYGDRVIDNAELRVPHPRMHERRFVLEPLVELAPDLAHPVLGKTMAALLQELRHGS